MVKLSVVGAHYGLRDWLVQRITALVMLFYTILLILFLLSAGQGGYKNWQALFACSWVKIISSITIVALLIHAWVGVRDIWMDYLHNVSLHLTMHVLTILWLIACFIYSCQVVWGV